MTAKSEELYLRSLELLNSECFRVCRQLPRPTDLVGDYEIGLLNALLRAFQDGVARVAITTVKPLFCDVLESLGLPLSSLIIELSTLLSVNAHVFNFSQVVV